MRTSCRPPDWLDSPAVAVLRDLQGAEPISGLSVVAFRPDDLNGLFLAIVEEPEHGEPLPQLEDDLDRSAPIVTEFGGSLVPRTLAAPALLVHVANLLQEYLAETSAAWGQSRPPCPKHPHPARAAIRDGEAWWICERDDEPLYRIGQGEVPTRPGPPLSWNVPRRSRRAEKRKYGLERKS